MILEPHSLGTKVKYRGQEIYSHVVFAIEATQLANDIGDMLGFLLPALWNKLPEVLKNVLKSQGSKPQMWDDFHKAVIAISPTDLCEEAVEISRHEDIYAEVRALKASMTGLTPVMAHTGLQPYRIGPMPTPQTPMPTRQQPPQYSAPVPKYLLAQVTPKTPAQNRQLQMTVTVRNPLNVPQTTPGTGPNPFISPAM